MRTHSEVKEGFLGAWRRTEILALATASLMLAGCHTLSETTFAVSDPSLITGGIPADHLTQSNMIVDSSGNAVQLSVTDQALPPSELNKTSLPLYRLEPPDVLLIQALRMAPKDPYFIQTLDVLSIVATGTTPAEPIAGTFQVEPSGHVNLGPSYGHVKIEGLSLRDAEAAIQRHLSENLTFPEVAVSLIQGSGQQFIAGEHLISMDGFVNLGKFGRVYVSGLTMEEAKTKIEEHLGQWLDKPIISLDVFAYNSKFYYIVTEGAGFGDRVFRLPATGNEMVLDAISQVQGFQRISNPKRMWISRPAPHDATCRQVLAVDWDGVVNGETRTNYQILPGDRIYIAGDRFIAFEQLVFKLTQPIERMLGFTLLGGQTIQNLQRFPEGFRTGF